MSTSGYRSIQNIFRTACKRAGLVNVTPHVMRHTFASRLGMEGVDIRTIQELGRWKDIRMVQRYANLSERHKAEAIEKLPNSHQEFHTQFHTRRFRKTCKSW